MEIGIIGLPQSGKSTLFEIMTGVNSRDAHGESHVRGLATFPDERFDHLASIYKPVKVSPAKVPFVDVNAQGEKAWDALRQILSGADGLVHVIDGFSATEVAEVLSAYRKLEDELILSDLIVVENRLAKVGKIPPKSLSPQDQAHLKILPSLKDHLEKGLPLRSAGLSLEDAFSLKSFSFWTIKPELIVINTGETNLALADIFAKEAGLTEPAIGICCQLEADIAALPPEERKEYLAAMGITEPAFGRVIRAAFSLLNRMCFFTVGEDEVKAWVIPVGTKAPKAAGTIHNDFERGFIKAEVVSYADFVASKSSIAAAKQAGKLRLEGKEYVVQDGDIITFRFNV
ncbi:MAG: DUF933 domain-containing protein [Smithellaceae bacterium]|nr:DUF933 domain-containing protein [Smithellaceae bacterium]